jgi:hypothetical protein
MYIAGPTFTIDSTCIKIGKYKIIGQNSHWVEKVKNVAKEHLSIKGHKDHT